jgi:hypothetical protein
MEQNIDKTKSDAWHAKDAVEDVAKLPVRGLLHVIEGAGEIMHKQERPVCKKCHRAWRWPRNISHVHIDNTIPINIGPGTLSTVIAHLTAVPGSDPAKATIPVDVFKTIEFALPWQPSHDSPDCLTSCFTSGCCEAPHRLIKEFDYDEESGDVYYDVENHREEKGVRYARLVTLNSWYIRLSSTLFRVSFSVLDYYCNLQLFLSLFYDDKLQETIAGYAMPFSVGFITMFLIQLVWSVKEARRKWQFNADPSKGDLIESCSFIDQTLCYISLVIFIFFSVERSVQEVVTILHPWKSVQPYCAFKANGARAYMIGYDSSDMYQVEEFGG